MISDTITKQIGEAMKAKDDVRLSTLKLLSSALNYEKIKKQHDLDGAEELAVVRHEAKMRKDAIEAYDNAGAKDRANKERAELSILQEFLPAEIAENKLIELVDQAIKETSASAISDMGKVIGAVMAKANGQADGSKVAELVKQKLTK